MAWTEGSDCAAAPPGSPCRRIQILLVEAVASGLGGNCVVFRASLAPESGRGIASQRNFSCWLSLRGISQVFYPPNACDLDNSSVAAVLLCRPDSSGYRSGR